MNLIAEYKLLNTEKQSFLSLLRHPLICEKLCRAYRLFILATLGLLNDPNVINYLTSRFMILYSARLHSLACDYE